MNKTAIARARVKQDTMDGLNLIADREGVKVSHVIRETLEEKVAEIPRCPHCQSTEIEHRDIHSGGAVHGESRCADCKTEVS